MSRYLRAICSNTISRHCKAPIEETNVSHLPYLIHWTRLTMPIYPRPEYVSHHRLIEPELLHQAISSNGCPSLEGLVEVVANEGAGGAGVGGRAKR